MFLELLTAIESLDRSGTGTGWRRYPAGQKSYSKTNSIKSKEFELEKKWWKNRVENEFAWKVPIDAIINRGYNLDIKHPELNEVDSELSLTHVLEQLISKNSQIQTLLQNLKSDLAL